jgi:hypothetical protein
MGGTSLSLSSASNHHHEFLFLFIYFCVCWPEFANCALKVKIKPTMSQKKLKTGLGFETLSQTRDWAKEKMANYELLGL